MNKLSILEIIQKKQFIRGENPWIYCEFLLDCFGWVTKSLGSVVAKLTLLGEAEI